MANSNRFPQSRGRLSSNRESERHRNLVSAGEVLLHYTPQRSPSLQTIDCHGSGVNNNPSTLFPCLNAINPHMCNYETRLATFTKWYYTTIQREEIAKAGFFYIGESDRVRCWNCNGGLQDWKAEDNPWIEHAKWYPLCDFILQKKGTEFVCETTLRFQNLRRPEIRNPSLSEPARIVRTLIENKFARNKALRETMVSIQRFSYKLHINTESELAPSNSISCGVCFVNKINTLILGYGHAYCSSCVKRTKKCAFCRSSVNFTHPIYLPFYDSK